MRRAHRFVRCERCGRRLRAGMLCGRCKAEVARLLAQARALVNLELRAIAYKGSVRTLRAHALPMIRRAAMEGLTLVREARRVQLRLTHLMLREAAGTGWVA